MSLSLHLNRINLLPFEVRMGFLGSNGSGSQKYNSREESMFRFRVLTVLAILVILVPAQAGIIHAQDTNVVGSVTDQQSSVSAVPGLRVEDLPSCDRAVVFPTYLPPQPSVLQDMTGVWQGDWDSVRGTRLAVGTDGTVIYMSSAWRDSRGAAYPFSAAQSSLTSGWVEWVNPETRSRFTFRYVPDRQQIYGDVYLTSGVHSTVNLTRCAWRS